MNSIEKRIPRRIAEFVERNVAGDPSRSERIVIHQTGTMRLQPGAKWRPFSAEQWSAVSTIAFCWHARVKMAPLVTAVVEDAFEDGRGRLDVRVWGKLPIAHGEGPDIDRGEVQRYLAELPWNPAAMVRNPALHYEELENQSIRVLAIDRETYVDLGFDEAGDIVGAYTETRVRGDSGPAPWQGVFGDYVEMGGVRIPRHGEVSWLLPSGKFTYWTGDITDVEQS